MVFCYVLLCVCVGWGYGRLGYCCGFVVEVFGVVLCVCFVFGCCMVVFGVLWLKLVNVVVSSVFWV